VRKLKAKREECQRDFFENVVGGGGGGGAKKKVRTRRQANNWRHHLLRNKILKGNDE
jgi:hypothetical protein